jgi:hypothetical protein
LLELPGMSRARTQEQWRAVLPPYLVAAIDYVTVDPPAGPAGTQGAAAP